MRTFIFIFDFRWIIHFQRGHKFYGLFSFHFTFTNDSWSLIFQFGVSWRTASFVCCNYSPMQQQIYLEHNIFFFLPTKCRGQRFQKFYYDKINIFWIWIFICIVWQHVHLWECYLSRIFLERCLSQIYGSNSEFFVSEFPKKKITDIFGRLFWIRILICLLEFFRESWLLVQNIWKWVFDFSCQKP